MKTIDDYKAAISKQAFFKDNKSHDARELDTLTKDIEVCVMQDEKRFAAFCKKSRLSSMDCSILLRWLFAQQPFIGNIKAEEKVPYQQALEYFEQARVNSIILNRLNYILHESMVEVYDLIESIATPNVLTLQSRAERIWDAYLSDRRKSVESSVWYAMQDHLRLASDAVRPFLDKVYDAIKDNMESKEYDDAFVKARCQMTFFLGKVAGHSFSAFFKDFKRESGVDYSMCFKGDDMRPMMNFFAMLCDAVGVKTIRDEYGYWTLEGFSADGDEAFQTAWKAFIDALRNDDLMDEAAMHAISLNPAIKEDYERVVAESNELEM